MSTNLAVADFTVRGANGPIPKVYGEALLDAALADRRIVCLSADLVPATETDLFRDRIPERFHHTGIAEANTVGIAGGMARMGEIPFVHSFCVFATRRCYDQIAMQAAYPNLPVKIVGFLPGLTTMLGVSHQAIDDLALMRALPNMTVIEPADIGQVRGAVEAALAHPGPVYLRMKRNDGALPDDFSHRPLERGRVEILREGPDGLLLAVGLMVEAAMEATNQLATRGLRVTVANVATIKPLDPAIAELAARLGTVVTAENHSVIGGLGSAVAELLLESGVQAGFRRVGVRDTFAEGGSTPFLRARYGLTAEAVVAAFEAARR
ncbi:MAG: transketolase [Mesorhizobium amorphae]|nr:MAG: transketolase [Mesorhizobium amorphae]